MELLGPLLLPTYETRSVSPTTLQSYNLATLAPARCHRQPFNTATLKSAWLPRQPTTLHLATLAPARGSQQPYNLATV